MSRYSLKIKGLRTIINGLTKHKSTFENIIKENRGSMSSISDFFTIFAYIRLSYEESVTIF